MNTGDKNKRIYECLKEIYLLTHSPDFEQLGGTPQNLVFYPLEISTLEDFQSNPEAFLGKEWGPEEVHLP